jgi:predicted transcriptional regulator of viral defense system
MYRHRNTNYLQRLTSQNKRVFRSSELALLWDITNKNTLYTTLTRYQKRGILFRLTTGLYSTLLINKLNPYELGCAISGPLSYISCETILANDGLLNQSIYSVTLMGKKRKEFTINNQKYICRFLNPKYLVNRIGISQKDGYSVASTLRAVADIKHIQPNYFIDGISQINNKELNKIQKQLGYL